jgi:hypothetical protein
MSIIGQVRHLDLNTSLGGTPSSRLVTNTATPLQFALAK